MKILLTVLIIIAVLIAAFFGFIYSGIYDVAADQPHTPAVFWILNTTMDRSVEARAKSIIVPPDFDKIDTSRAAEDFKNICVNCHVAPGIQHSLFGMGLNPLPPDLGESAGELNAPTIFWVARHGIKMTGMPAFGKMLSDPELWAITAYIKGFSKRQQ